MSLFEHAKVVEAPTIFPYCCENCQAQKGPMIDTGVDRPAMGGHVRVYICRSCVKGMAELMGYAKGPKMDELDKAADLLAQTQQNEREMNERIGLLEETVSERDAKLAVANTELERLRGVEETVRFRAAQLRDQAAELVAAGS